MAYSIEDFAGRDISKAREIIKALTGGQIVLEPTEGGGLNARLRSDMGGLIKLVEEATPPGKRSGGKRKVSALAGPRNHIQLGLRPSNVSRFSPELLSRCTVGWVTSFV